MDFLPRWIALEVTRRCNLDCVHCRSSAEPVAPDEELDTGEVLALMDAMAELSSPALVLTGGEPLLRGDLFELLRYGTQRGLRMCVATNGALLTERHCREFLAAKVRMVSLSLDGANAAVHDGFRRVPGAFAATLHGAGLLRRHGIPFLVNSSFTRVNRGAMAAVCDLAKELGAVAWYMFLVTPSGRGREILDELIPAGEYLEILRWHRDRERAEESLIMRPTCAPYYFRLLEQNPGEARRHLDAALATGARRGCLAGRSICFIDACGNLKPCSYFPDAAGNVRETPLRELWFEAGLLRELRDPQSLRGACGRCAFREICGGCRVRAAALCGDFREADPFCPWHGVDALV